MWLKLCRGRYFELKDVGQLFVQGSHEVYLKPGIYWGRPSDEYLLLPFDSQEEACESLDNLFRAWSKYRSSIFLKPQGLDWVIEAIGREQETKR
jgi:hypothetical protein